LLFILTSKFVWKSFDYREDANEVSFKGKRPDETTILFLRRHWLVLIFKLFPALFFLIALLLVLFLRDFWLIMLGWEKAFFDLFFASLWMFFWILLFIIWIDYYLDVWIVTDQRIINIEQASLFRRRISELEMGKIQDVTSQVQGIIPTLFRYGYVYVQTAGEKERFVFCEVPNPAKVKNIIMQIQKRALLKEKREEGAILRGKL